MDYFQGGKYDRKHGGIYRGNAPKIQTYLPPPTPSEHSPVEANDWVLFNVRKVKHWCPCYRSLLKSVASVSDVGAALVREEHMTECV
jgi:hypothetical protein